MKLKQICEESNNAKSPDFEFLGINFSLSGNYLMVYRLHASRTGRVFSRVISHVKRTNRQRKSLRIILV